MHKEIIINSSPNEVRVALLEDHEVVEFSMERADNRRAVGNVYKGVVTAVRPGLQAAFVEIGMEKAGFLHVSDLIHDSPADEDESGRGGRGRPRRHRREGLRPIETMLKEGDEILVQVTKEVIGTKGPRLTADISLPGRFMVLMPKGDHVGVSRKIEDRKERVRLKQILADLKPGDEAGAFIIRTAAIGQDAKMIERDMQYLRQLWKTILENAHARKAPTVVHEDVGLIVSLVRDIFKDDIDSVVVDNRDDYQQLMAYVRNFSPDLRERVHFYDGDLPIFDKYGIEAELKKSLDKKVWMKRGGFLVIEQTEALVAIDVNTGRFTGKKNQAETIFKTNMVAAKEIARQLRLRDVGGIIVLDFIDMESEDDKRRVLQELRTHLKRDRSRTKTFAVSDLGLIEMSRQRIQESLKDRLSDDCPYCHGAGQILSVDTLSNKVERLLMKLGATGGETAVQVRANPTLALRLMTERANSLQNIARAAGIRVDVVDDPRLHREEFQIVSLKRRKDLVAEIERASVQSDVRAGAERRPNVEAEPERGDRGERSDRRRRGRGDDEGPRGGRDAEPREGREGRDGRRRRRRDEDAPRADQEAPRNSRRAAADDEAPNEREGRSRRRRRGGADDESEARSSRDESMTTRSTRAEAAPAAAAAASGDHPADEGTDEARRRRRRRGRRGGRGRRRPDRPEDELEATTTVAGATQNSQPVDSPADPMIETEDTDLELRDDQDDRPDRAPRRPRRSRRFGRDRDADASSEGARESVVEPDAATDEVEEASPRRRERPTSSPRRSSPVASSEGYLRPVPEDEYLAAMADEADSAGDPRPASGNGTVARSAEDADDTDDILRSHDRTMEVEDPRDAEDADVDSEDESSAEAAAIDDDEDEDVANVAAAGNRGATDQESDDDGDDEQDDPRALRRRRRGRRRAAGRPTRLIGTGKKSDED